MIRPLYIDGAWVETGTTFTVVDPGNGETVAEVASGGRDEARRALQSAARALPGWRDLTGMQRGDLLLAAAQAMTRRREEIARTVTRENGKPYDQSAGEVDVSIDHLRWFAEEARRGYGRIVPNQVQGKRHLILKQPVGVVAAISPWNFPLVLAARKVAPALAAGCTVVLKPASQTPLCALLFGECLEEAGIPPGVFHVIAGNSRAIGAEFMENPLCAKVSFTGSTEVGKTLIEQSARTVTHLSLELGGHAPVLVFADADLDQAVEGALITKFRNNGQSCIAANRIYVERPIYEEFLERFCRRVRAMKTGYGMEDDVEIGAIVNAEGLETALAHIRNAVEAGGRVLCGGETLEDTQGYYLTPTVIADVPATARCMREETFAPVAPVAAFDTEEEVIEAANDTRYGLAAYAYTSDLNRAFRLMDRLDAGSVGINDAVPSTSNCPFGGMKESGLGRELGIEGMEAFLEVKHVSLGVITTPR
jgi:succinate-semialdehyde dehydrogenase / glutarate-semialdehyde dehydrogenase